VETVTSTARIQLLHKPGVHSRNRQWEDQGERSVEQCVPLSAAVREDKQTENLERRIT
jgi:hypothetical protein